MRRLPAVDDEVRAAALNAEGMARLELRDLDGAVAVAEQDRAAATAAGDRPALSRALVPLPWPRACGPTWAAPGS